MKKSDAFEKIRSKNTMEREDAAWEIYVNAIHSFKTLAHFASIEKDENVRSLLESMVRDFKVKYEND